MRKIRLIKSHAKLKVRETHIQCCKAAWCLHRFLKRLRPTFVWVLRNLLSLLLKACTFCASQKRTSRFMQLKM